MGGALIQWKEDWTQRISRVPASSYSNLRLPNSQVKPNDSVWQGDKDSREWSNLPDVMFDKNKGNVLQQHKQTNHFKNPTALKYFEHSIPHEYRRDGCCLESNDSITQSIRDSKFEDDCVDYVEHIVLPSSTMEGICISYKISATKLRQWNGFSGSSLLLAPKKLIIPLLNRSQKIGQIRMQNQTTDEYKIHKMIFECPILREIEAKAYLDHHNWDLEQSIVTAKADLNWKKESSNLDTERCKLDGKETFSYFSTGKGSTKSEPWLHCTDEEKGECKVSEASIVELKLLKKTTKKNLPRIFSNNYYVETNFQGIPILATTDMLRQHVAKSIVHKDYRKVQVIDFGIELQVLKK